ncbi:MAG: low molecular weight protein-tyrosine-phosphatase [Neisseriaceae bacterium]
MKTINVLFVCLGNICRSPIAQGIFENKIRNLNLTSSFEIDSAGTSAFHLNSDPDPRSTNVLNKHGITLKHKARQFIMEDFTRYNYILAMDHLNYEDIMNLSNNKNHDSKRVFLLRSFDNNKTDFNILDPYYGLDTDFEEVYQICNQSIDGFITFLNNEKLIHIHSNNNMAL